MKKFLCFVLTFMLVCTSVMFTGCGKDVTLDKSSQGGEQQTSGDSTEESENTDPLGKYKEPIEITAVIGFRPPEDPKTPKDVTPETQSWIKLVEDKLNIKLKFLWTVPADQYEQKFGVTMASGDLPDLLELDQKQYGNLYEAGQLADLTKAYNDYASPLLKQYVEADGGGALNSVKRDKKLYGIPNYTDPKQATQLLWIREDWLENLNMQAPKTIDELEQLAEAFVKNDPDKNGKDDTYGLGIQKKPIYWGFDVRGYFYGYGAYPGMWVKDANGNLVVGEIQPQVRNALLGLQRMYKKGLIDKEFAMKDENKVVEDIVAGRVGLVYGEWWYPNWPLNMNREKDPKAKWKCYPIPSSDGSPAKTGIPTVMLNTIQSVSAKCKNPEAAIKMMNLYIDLSEDKYGESVLAENGYVYHWVPQRIYYPMMIEHMYNFTNEALKANKDPESVVDPFNVGADAVYEKSKSWFDNKKDFTEWGAYFSRAAEDGGWGVTKKIFESGNIVRNEYYGPATPTMQEKGAAFDKMLDETFDKIIMGADISEFDKYVQTWKKLGGDDLTKEVNEWYDKNVK